MTAGTADLLDYYCRQARHLIGGGDLVMAAALLAAAAAQYELADQYHHGANTVRGDATGIAFRLRSALVALTYRKPADAMRELAAIQRDHVGVRLRVVERGDEQAPASQSTKRRPPKLRLIAGGGP